MCQAMEITAQNGSDTLLRILSLVARKGYNVSTVTSSRGKLGLGRFFVILEDVDRGFDVLVKQIKRLVEVVDVNLVDHEMFQYNTNFEREKRSA